MKEIVSYKHGSFIDFEGKKRQVTICAVSYDPVDKFGYNNTVYAALDENWDERKAVDVAVRKLSIGYSICTPPDVYDKTLGETYAYRCAKSKRGKSLYATQTGLISSKMVDAILEQELDFLCKNPEAVIYCYRLEKEKHDTLEELWKEYDSFNEYEKEAFTHDVDLDKLSKLRKKMINCGVNLKS